MKNRLFMLDLAIFAATIFASSAQAQRHVASAQASRPRMNLARRAGVRSPVVPLRRSRQFSSGSGFAPYFYSDYDSDSGIIEVPTNQNVERTAQPASPAPVPTRPQSLLLELHGDRWVRITNYGQSQTDGQSSEPEPQQASDLPSATPANTPRRIPTAEPPSELPPAVLVFRDREICDRSLNHIHQRRSLEQRFVDTKGSDRSAGCSRNPETESGAGHKV